MHNVWNNSRLPVLLSTLLLLILRPTLADEAAVMQEIGKLANLSGDHCQWPGVQCASGRVLGIDLHGKSLTEELPRDLNQLSELQRLNVMDNNLKGSLPNLSNLSNLQQARFDSNQFTNVPTGHLSGLTSLQFFSIDNNPNLATWNVFSELKDSLPELLYLSACNASLAGPIPEILGRLKALKLSYNKFEGPLPASLAGPGMQTLRLDNQLGRTKLSGGIDVIGSMSSVLQVWLHANQFSGPIPDLSNCKELVDLELRDNQFSGTISPAIANLTSLRNLTLSNNHLTGPIPASLTSLHRLTLLDVSNNNLSGEIPDFPPYVVVNFSGNLHPSSVSINPSPASSGSNNPSPASSGSINGGKGLSPWALAVAAIVANLLC